LSRTNDVYLATIFALGQDTEDRDYVSQYCKKVLKIPFAEWEGNQSAILAWLEGIHIDFVHYEWPLSLKNYCPQLGAFHIFTFMESVSLRFLIDLHSDTIPSDKKDLWFSEYARFLKIELVDTNPMDMLITVTDKDADYFRKLIPFNNYMVLNHGVNFEDIKSTEIETEKHTILFLGNYLHYPNADAMRFFLKEIFPIVLATVPDAWIEIVGPNLPQDIICLATETRASIIGEVQDIQPYIQRAEVCIAPLISGAGMRGKVVDYASLKKPFVATDIAMAGLAFIEGADYLKANDAVTFAKGIISIIENPEESRKMAEHAYETAKRNYDNAELTQRLIDIYSLLEDSSDGR
jgi:glycosyltransferase involved in cell wall biosynthesis